MQAATAAWLFDMAAVADVLHSGDPIPVGCLTYHSCEHAGRICKQCVLCPVSLMVGQYAALLRRAGRAIYRRNIISFRILEIDRIKPQPAYSSCYRQWVGGGAQLLGLQKRWFDVSGMPTLKGGARLHPTVDDTTCTSPPGSGHCGLCACLWQAVEGSCLEGRHEASCDCAQCCSL